jgi:hypothetical protein
LAYSDLNRFAILKIVGVTKEKMLHERGMIQNTGEADDCRRDTFWWACKSSYIRNPITFYWAIAIWKSCPDIALDQNPAVILAVCQNAKLRRRL